MLSLEYVGHSAPEDILYNFTKTEVPFFIVMGEYDYQTTANMAKEFYLKLDAPIKEYVLFKDAAHQIAFDYPQEFAKYVASVLDKADTNRDSTPAANEYEIVAERDYFEDLMFK